MPFQKGHKLGKGRPKGSKNIATIEKKLLIDMLKQEGAAKFQQELLGLSGKDYCDSFSKVVEIAFPKQARVETKVEGSLELQGVQVYLPDKNEKLEASQEAGESPDE